MQHVLLGSARGLAHRVHKVMGVRHTHKLLLLLLPLTQCAQIHRLLGLIVALVDTEHGRLLRLQVIISHGSAVVTVACVGALLFRLLLVLLLPLLPLLLANLGSVLARLLGPLLGGLELDTE